MAKILTIIFHRVPRLVHRNDAKVSNRRNEVALIYRHRTKSIRVTRRLDRQPGNPKCIDLMVGLKMKTAASTTAEQLSHEVAVLYYSRSSDVDNWEQLRSSGRIDLPARKTVDLPPDRLFFVDYRSSVLPQATSCTSAGMAISSSR